MSNFVNEYDSIARDNDLDSDQVLLDTVNV